MGGKGMANEDDRTPGGFAGAERPRFLGLLSLTALAFGDIGSLIRLS